MQICDHKSSVGTASVRRSAMCGHGTQRDHCKITAAGEERCGAVSRSQKSL
jgi:hypothetical protein